jgi:hypothetical protein
MTLHVPARRIPKVRKDGVHARLHLRLVEVEFQLAALHLSRLIDGHLLEDAIPKIVGDTVAKEKIFYAVGRGKNDADDQ